MKHLASEGEILHELMKISETQNPQHALTKLNLLSMIPQNPELSPLSNWQRLGAETYTLNFQSKDGNMEYKCVIKACVKLGIGISISGIISDWLRKRQLLSSTGITTPSLYGHGNGCIVEEYIPMSFLSAFENCSAQQDELIRSLAHTTYQLSKLKFNPINIVPNLMSRGHDAVWVDFGEDLGEQGSQVKNLLPLVTDELKSRLNNLPQKAIDQLHYYYSQGEKLYEQNSCSC